MSRVILLDPGHGGRRNAATWIERICLHCGKHFSVRECYVKLGKGKFCSTGCGTSYRNNVANPAKLPSVREKMSAHHADVSGGNNPMHGKTGSLAPGFIDGRHAIADCAYRGKAILAHGAQCELCGREDGMHRLDVHHKDRDRSNNSPENLMVLCPSCHQCQAHPKVRDKYGRFSHNV